VAIAAGPATQPADKPLTAASPMDEILDALDATGKNLKDFTADVTLITEDLTLATESSKEGKILFQKPANANARVKVEFSQRSNGNLSRPEHVVYLLNDGWLTTRQYDQKPPTEDRKQVLKPGEKIDLLKLGEGPFPLPIGQDKADVHKNFTVKKIPPGKEDPTWDQTVHLELTPLDPQSSLGRKFKKIDVWTDLKQQMPVQIQTLDVNEAETNTTELKNLKLNAGLTDKDFVLEPVGNDWNRVTEPFTD
jgi:outer membrane lipoprotein-sorting protein